MARYINITLALLLGGLLGGCGTDTSSGNQATAGGGTPTAGVNITQSGSSGSRQSSFSLRLTDAAVDSAARVVVQFSAVQLKRKDGGWAKYDFANPLALDLLQLQGTKTADLLVHMPIESGDYDEVRIFVDSTPMVNFIELASGATHELTIPSASFSGLKLRGDFTVPSNRAANLTIDFDLRRSILRVGISGNYNLNPVLRLVNDKDVGHIRGTLDPALLTGPNCSDADINTHNAIYVYTGNNVTPDDINLKSKRNVDPVTTSLIKLDSASGKFMYEAAFLPAGRYTIAFTCSADQEDIESANDNLKFFNIQNVSVLVNDTLFL